MVNILITILGIIILVLIWITLYDSNRFVIRNYRIHDERILKQVRIIILSDLHGKKFGSANEKLVDAIKEQKPDIIVVAGDMVTCSRHSGSREAIEVLEPFSGEIPIFYVNGNHEQKLRDCPEEYGSEYSDYEESLKKLGISAMINSHVVLDEYGLCIYGLETDSNYYTKFHSAQMPPDYIEDLMGDPTHDRYNILIAHNPDYFPRYAQWGADLVISGHIHGGMVRIPGWRGIISPTYRLFPKYDGGIFREGGSIMLLSRGLGMHTIPVRTFNPGEFWVLDMLPLEE